jgi:hypothetical protein
MGHWLKAGRFEKTERPIKTDKEKEVITSIQNFIQIHQSVQKVQPPQKLKRSPIWSDRRHLQWHHLHTKFHPNSTIGSKAATTTKV